MVNLVVAAGVEVYLEVAAGVDGLFSCCCWC